MEAHITDQMHHNTEPPTRLLPAQVINVQKTSFYCSRYYATKIDICNLELSLDDTKF